ncbi:formimidoylglutamase [Staphylococcus agnetis]|uniref:formimidoylglutamase n=1 Tax=Staphylococcus agnetis TaxID=985762 RepID=UPI000D1A386D|nr:formimidoylglutamase [Staphylococcus agnetis]NJH66918.1 formimidoylglutamase [Staphylococcus agnetis]PTH67591.1 formimidoylglutamase [Staphylococcus agnetis]
MYQSPQRHVWTGRLDSAVERESFRHFQTIHFGDIHNIASQANGIALFGYAVDKGVELNKGRTGAKDGPDAIKKAFANLPAATETSIIDYGNLTHSQSQLIETQKIFGTYVHQLIKNHQRTFLLGGGHDIAYAQYLGVRAAYPNQSIGVINIDAHFDTRKEAESTSGTSFRQMIEEDSNLDYFVIGIQRPGNTSSLFRYAEETQTQYVLADELVEHIDPRIKDKIEHFITHHDVILFTICMDVIDSAYAPGVSASAVLGLTPHCVLSLAKRILQFDNVMTVSIAEMNPTYDVDQRTAKLIGQFLSHFIHYS